MHLKFEEVFTSLQTVRKIAQKEPNINTLRVTHQATSSPTPLTVTPQLSVQSLPDILIIQVYSLFYQFLLMEKRFTYDDTFKSKVTLCTEKMQLVESTQ
jgi:hypothetical protein